MQVKEDKTELVMVTPSQQAGKGDIESVQVGGCDIKPTSSALNRRATSDQHMTLQPHISSLVISSDWQLWKIGQLRKYLTKHVVDKLIHIFISSYLDNGNGLQFCLPDYQIK